MVRSSARTAGTLLIFFERQWHSESFRVRPQYFIHIFASIRRRYFLSQRTVWRRTVIWRRSRSWLVSTRLATSNPQILILYTSSINIPWPEGGMGDAEYLHAFQTIVMPIAMEFSPQLVISQFFSRSSEEETHRLRQSPPDLMLQPEILLVGAKFRPQDTPI